VRQEHNKLIRDRIPEIIRQAGRECEVQIIEQKDEFSSISEFEFAEIAFGFPLQLLALTPLLRIVVRKKAAEKLSQFMQDRGY
jgi:hypothetical protein